MTDRSTILKWLSGYPDKDVLDLVSRGCELRKAGDELFTFLYHEAEDAYGDPRDFQQMLRRAQEDLEEVIEALQKQLT